MSVESPATNELQLRDIKAPVEIPAEWAWLWWAAALILVAAAAFFIWRRHRSRTVAPPPIPRIPAYRRARRQLDDALRSLGDPKAFTVLVSDAIRSYIEEQFDLRAPERTTEEFLHELQTKPSFTPEQKESLRLFLSQCDLVKFARYEPAEEELLELHRAAVRFVDETEPRPIPPPQPQGAAA